MRLGDLDALSAFVGDLRSSLHKEQSTFKAMTQSEFEIKDNMLLNFQYAIDNAPTVEPDKLSSALNCSIRAEYGGCEGCELSCPRNELIRILNLERPHGKWIGVVYSNNRIGVGMCNQCGVNRIIDNFCPNCGADMRGGAE